MLDLSIIIVNFNTKEITKKCLEAIFAQKTNLRYEVVVVDNGSTDSSVEEIKKLFPKVHLIQSDTNLGFSGGNNLGIKKLQAKL
jgi:GT2 family glycosyltransferase